MATHVVVMLCPTNGRKEIVRAWYQVTTIDQKLPSSDPSTLYRRYWWIRLQVGGFLREKNTVLFMDTVLYTGYKANRRFPPPN